ncbi:MULTISPECIES: hypothetical protein [Aeromonas]|uniref:Uncharacterized protein n=1 Tax=Aeromonas caviae TaxID=648 RepID=A0AA42VG04_AERCA|nr:MULTISPECIES: hypothetical protein [Aeromonas]HEB5079608.1 hypothetical protein [Aeromonas hydrophila subsp. hydrophila]MBP4061144.1 hypothetical protein [Aeromonas sp. Prich7-2]MCW4618042.1 hypothetical protein [Aeromonas hydrophila]MDH0309587.1 hypothetical protein [Aeromonas caviae]MDH0319849.1 hypothetical protein [Aeromonas caviae]
MYFRAKITEPEQVVATWQNIMAELAEEGVFITPTMPGDGGLYGCNLTGNIPFRGVTKRIDAGQVVMLLLLALHNAFDMIDDQSRNFTDLCLSEQLKHLQSVGISDAPVQQLQEAVKQILSKHKGLFEFAFY